MKGTAVRLSSVLSKGTSKPRKQGLGQNFNGSLKAEPRLCRTFTCRATVQVAGRRSRFVRNNAHCIPSFFLIYLRALSCSKSRLAIVAVGDFIQTLSLKHVETWCYEPTLHHWHAFDTPFFGVVYLGLAWFSCPYSYGPSLYIVAPHLVVLFYTPTWLDSVPILTQIAPRRIRPSENDIDMHGLAILHNYNRFECRRLASTSALYSSPIVRWSLTRSESIILFIKEIASWSQWLATLTQLSVQTLPLLRFIYLIHIARFSAPLSSQPSIYVSGKAFRLLKYECSHLTQKRAIPLLALTLREYPDYRQTMLTYTGINVIVD